MPNDGLPSFLRDRIRKADAARAARNSTTAAKSIPTAADQAPKPVTASIATSGPVTPSRQPAARKAKKGKAITTAAEAKSVGSAEIGVGCEWDDVPVSVRPTVLALIHAMEAQSTDTVAFQAGRPILPATVAAIVAGAQMAGHKGNADRMALFRMLGLKLYTPNGTGTAGLADDRGEGATERLATRLARVEAKLTGRKTVTLDATTGEEVADVLDLPAIAHMMKDRERVPEGRDEGKEGQEEG